MVWTLVVAQPQGSERRQRLRPGDSTIGRSPECDIVIDDGGASRIHALLSHLGDVVVVRDLGSANGTWVNDQRIAGSRMLVSGDRLQLGDTVVIVESDRSTGREHGAPESPLAGTRPWYSRVKTLVIAAGAVAGALTAVIALWAALFPRDVEDFAEIASLENLGTTHFSEFSTDRLGTTIELDPAPPSALAMGVGGAVLPTAGPTLAPTTAPTPQPTTMTTREPGTFPGTTLPGGVIPVPPPGDAMLEEGDENLLGPGVPVMSATSGAGTSQPGTGDPAVALREAMSWVEYVETPEGTDYLGSTVAVGVATEGLADRDLWITWWLAGPDVPEVWTQENLAYTMHASTDRDRGSVTLWVPDLLAPAEYQVNVRLSHANGAPIHERTLVIPAEE